MKTFEITYNASTLFLHFVQYEWTLLSYFCTIYVAVYVLYVRYVRSIIVQYTVEVYNM